MCSLINWKLKEVMDREQITGEELAEVLETTRRSITRLRAREMPAINEAKFSALLIALNKLRKTSEEIITPHDLIVFSLTMDEMKDIENYREEHPF